MFPPRPRGPAAPRTVLLLAAVLLAQAPPARAAVMYEVIDLGTLGGNQSFALDVNNNRQVTGNASTVPGSNLPLNAFRFDNGVLTNLGVLPGGVNFSRGFGINDAGVVVGESDNNVPRAFRFENGVLTDLGTLGGTSAVANDINNRGQVVGASSNGTATRPFLLQNGQLFDLGTLDGRTDTTGRATAINQAGDAAGVSRTATGTSQATLWRGDPAAGTVTLTNLGSLGNGQQFSQAFGLNDAGQVVGESVLTGNTFRAFFWENGVLTDLGILPDVPALVHSRANDINDAGLAVGHVTGFQGFPTINGRAVIWENGVIADLNTRIAADSGWVLRSAEAVNDRGDIVGFGTRNGQTRAFLLTPVAVPEPSGLTLLALGGLALARLRRRAGRAPRPDPGRRPGRPTRPG